MTLFYTITQIAWVNGGMSRKLFEVFFLSFKNGLVMWIYSILCASELLSSVSLFSVIQYVDAWWHFSQHQRIFNHFSSSFRCYKRWRCNNIVQWRNLRWSPQQTHGCITCITFVTGAKCVHFPVMIIISLAVWEYILLQYWDISNHVTSGDYCPQSPCANRVMN